MNEILSALQVSPNAALLSSVAGAALLHTLIGIDHYLPISVLARAQNWSRPRLLTITLLACSAHLLASIVLAFIGIWLSASIIAIADIQAVRGTLATYALIAFALIYLGWTWRRKTTNQHKHTRQTLARRLTITPLLMIFIIGPCEPLIPLIMAPAISGAYMLTFLLVALYAGATIITMTCAVIASGWGISLWQQNSDTLSARTMHLMAGGTLLSCGIAVAIFGI